MGKHRIVLKKGVEFEYTDEQVSESTVGSEGAKQAIRDVTYYGEIKREKIALESSNSKYPGKRWVRRGYSSKLDEQIKRNRRTEK